MKGYKELLIALTGRLILWISWPDSSFTPLIFFAWIPLLFVEDHINSWKRLLAITYLHMLVWNILTTWWVWNASAGGAVGAFVVNSLIMCIPILLFHFTKKTLGRWMGYGALIVYWVSYEYLHHNWELSWPWLTLGNVFAMKPEWVQWYQYTGTTGGSIWVLLTNVLIYALIAEYRKNGRTIVYYSSIASFLVVLIVPIITSRLILGRERDIALAGMQDAKYNVVVVQPNVDPYYEKYSGTVEAQVQRLIVLSESKIDKDTRLVVWPETAIPVSVNEREIKEDFRYRPIWTFLQRHPFLHIVTGIDSYREYGTNKDSATQTARLHKESGIWYDMFNTAVALDADTTVQIYHKGKLVPGVESLPSYLNFISTWFEKFGGASGSLGTDKERKVFVPWDNYYRSAPVICYESIYGDYLTGFVRGGANILTIITNDGWWGNTPGYRQHMQYARLRAIETRMWIARSANTGISCFIDPLGNVVDPQPWDTQAAIKMNIPVNNRQTYFVKHGDIISTAGMIPASFVVLLYALFIYARKKRRSKKLRSHA